jgi:hypothetical protein
LCLTTKDKLKVVFKEKGKKEGGKVGKKGEIKGK